jgi:hypothetical protein
VLFNKTFLLFLILLNCKVSCQVLGFPLLYHSLLHFLRLFLFGVLNFLCDINAQLKAEMKKYQDKLRIHVGHMAGAGSRRSQGARMYDESGMKLEWRGKPWRRGSEICKGYC